MASELIVYANDLNKAKFRGFDATDTDLFMALCFLAKDRSSNKIEVSFSDLKKISHFRNCSNSDFYNRLRDLKPKIFSMTMGYEVDDEEIDFVLFPTFRTNKREGKLTISVNDEFTYILNGITKNFTMLDLAILTRIRGRYAKTLYRNLVQFRKTGNYSVKLQEFRLLYDVPDTTDSKYIMRDIIKPCLLELSPYFSELECVPFYEKKRGKPLGGFRFSFKSLNKTTNSKPVSKSSNKKWNDFEQSVTYSNLDDFEKMILSN